MARRRAGSGTVNGMWLWGVWIGPGPPLSIPGSRGLGKAAVSRCNALALGSTLMELCSLALSLFLFFANVRSVAPELRR